VSWIDAFAEYIGRKIVVQWIDRSEDSQFAVSDRDGKIDA